MRIRINMDNGILNVPYKGFEVLQRFVYELLGSYENVEWIHNEGARLENKRYKPLVYSHFHGNRVALKHNFKYFAPISLYISSPIPDIIFAIEKQINKRAYYRFAGKTLTICSYEMIDTEQVSSRIFQTMSPIVCSTPIKIADNKFYQKFVSPFEKEYQEIIKINLQNKAKLFYNLELNNNFTIKPLFTQDSNKYHHLFYFKNSAIKCWSGKYEIHGDINYLYVANNCGIGSKNAQGFGLINILGEYNEEN